MSNPFGLPAEIAATLTPLEDAGPTTAATRAESVGCDCACSRVPWFFARMFAPQPQFLPLTAEQAAYYASEDWAAHVAHWTEEAQCQSSD